VECSVVEADSAAVRAVAVAAEDLAALAAGVVAAAAQAAVGKCNS